MLTLTPNEVARLVADGLDPAAYTAIPVQGEADLAHAGEAEFQGTTLVVVTVRLLFPRAVFRKGGVLGKAARINPLVGTHPILDGRMLVPKAALAAEVLGPDVPPLPVLRREDPTPD